MRGTQGRGVRENRGIGYSILTGCGENSPLKLATMSVMLLSELNNTQTYSIF